MKKDELITLLYKHQYSSVYLSENGINWVEEPEYLESTEEYEVIKNKQGGKYSLVVLLKSNEEIVDDELMEHLEKIQITGLTISAGLKFLPPNIGKLKNLIDLNLSDNKLSKLPSEIGQLKNLVSLYLIENELSTLPSEIRQLTQLTVLCLIRNRFFTLPSEIGDLSNLKELDLYGNSLRSLPVEIWKLNNLETLTLSYNSLRSLPPKIGRLLQLQNLYIDNNYIQTLPKELWTLTQLRNLDLSCNKLVIIPPEIVQLVNLETFNFSNRDFDDNVQVGNKISQLPAEIQKLQNLKYLDLRDNLLNIPFEIASKIEEPHIILNYYFTLLQKQNRPLNEIKLLIIGQGSVGKTSIIRRVMLNKFNTGQVKTKGISINQWRAENNFEIQLNIWDFGGQEIMHATHQFFLTKRSLYLLVLDSRLTQEENRVEYWLKIIQSFGGESPVLIIGNKIDQHPLDIDRTGLQKKYPNIVGILETSAATGAGIEELKAAITNQVNNLPHVRDLLPETWFTVKTKLEGLGRESNFITHDKYLELCAENEVNDETSQRTLIGFLHDLGVVLHFQDDPRLEALGILNPQWVTNGVYKILNSQALFQNKGVLTVSMLDEILNLPEYPRGKRLFIVDMMKKFELCYDIESDRTFLVPDLLPKDQPDLTFNGIPAFEYAYPVLPSSVITRFIVRMNQKIDDGFVWRTGVVLRVGDNKALIKADIEDRKITIAIDGLEHTRRDALSAIRYQLDEIHASIKGLDAQKRVPIPNAPNAEPLKYEYLLMLEREGQEVHLVQDGNRLVKINVRQVLSGIESEIARKESASRIINIYGDVTDSNILAGDENELNK
jgi:internalin A